MVKTGLISSVRQCGERGENGRAGTVGIFDRLTRLFSVLCDGGEGGIPTASVENKELRASASSRSATIARKPRWTHVLRTRRHMRDVCSRVPRLSPRRRPFRPSMPLAYAVKRRHTSLPLAITHVAGLSEGIWTFAPRLGLPPVTAQVASGTVPLYPSSIDGSQPWGVRLTASCPAH